MPFPPTTVENLLVKSARSCCLCRQYKGTKLEIHHILPEAAGGSSEEDNGITLCFDCHSDVQTYNDNHPRGRKFRPDELKRHRDEWFKLVASGVVASKLSDRQGPDTELIRFYSQCLDRPAFQDRFSQERNTEAFDKALEDTITAINTGCLMSREGQVLDRSKGKSHLHSLEYRREMDAIVGRLRDMRRVYDEKVKSGEIWQGDMHRGQRMYCINDRELANWFDNSRLEVVQRMNSLCEAEGIPSLNIEIG